MNFKICYCCKQQKLLSDFSKKKSSPDGLNYWCKTCCKEYLKKYREKNKEKAKKYQKDYYQQNKEKIQKQHKEYAKKYYEENKVRLNEWRKNYYLNNRDTIIKKANECRANNKLHRNEYERNRRKENLNLRLRNTLRERINSALKKNKKNQTTLMLIGCSLEELKKHLESQFKPGMSWKNRGRNGWHIDHIKPCASFDLSKSEEQHKCFHYSNLQPLWAKENLRKGIK